MSDVLSVVERTIDEHDLLAPDAVVVGVSGGPDSLCLLHVLRRLKEHYGLHLHVAHLHHGARGERADEDARFVAQQAAAWDLPATIERRNVPQLAHEHGLAFEEAARRVRYAFLARVAGEIEAHRIAVGHNADDQAETVLMHFLRGSGPAGLRGMLHRTRLTDYRLLEPFDAPPQGTMAIIRPLLDVPRAEIEQYCAEHDLSPRFDRSNLDTTYFRNRLRHELLPLLETYTPNIRTRLCHTAAVMAADYELLAELRKEAWAKIVQSERQAAIVFDRQAWRALPTGLQRSTLRQAAYRLRHSLRDVSYVHVENARQIALNGETGDQATLPMDLMLTVGYETLTMAPQDHTRPPPDEPLLWTEEPIAVHVPGETALPESEWTLRSRLLDAWDMTQIVENENDWMAHFDADALLEPLVLRAREPGDRFRPQGMEGHTVKLNAYLINEKVPQAWRDRMPLLVADGTIAWVCGRRLSEPFIVRRKTQRVAQLWFERRTV